MRLTCTPLVQNNQVCKFSVQRRLYLNSVCVLFIGLDLLFHSPVSHTSLVFVVSFLSFMVQEFPISAPSIC